MRYEVNTCDLCLPHTLIYPKDYLVISLIPAIAIFNKFILKEPQLIIQIRNSKITILIVDALLQQLIVVVFYINPSFCFNRLQDSIKERGINY